MCCCAPPPRFAAFGRRGNATTTTGGLNEPEGGAISVAGSASLEATACIFDGNTSVSNTGAVMVSQQNYVKMIDCIFNNNSAANTAGAVRIHASAAATLELIGCTFADNTLPGSGVPALRIGSGGSALVENCTFDGNSSVSGGGAAMISQGGQAAVQATALSACRTCSCFWPRGGRAPHRVRPTSPATAPSACLIFSCSLLRGGRARNSLEVDHGVAGHFAWAANRLPMLVEWALHRASRASRGRRCHPARVAGELELKRDGDPFNPSTVFAFDYRDSMRKDANACDDLLNA